MQGKEPVENTLHEKATNSVDLEVSALSDEDLYREIFRDSLERAFRSSVDVPLLEGRSIFELPALAEETLGTFLDYKAKDSTAPPLLYKSFSILDRVLTSFSEISRKTNRVISPDLRLLFMLLEEGPCKKAFSYPLEDTERETIDLQGFYGSDLVVKLLDIDSDVFIDLLSLPCLEGLYSTIAHDGFSDRSKEVAPRVFKDCTLVLDALDDFLSIGENSTDLGEVVSILESTYGDTGLSLVGFDLSGGNTYFDPYVISSPKFRKPLYPFIRELFLDSKKEGSAGLSVSDVNYSNLNEFTFLYAFYYLREVLREGEALYREGVLSDSLNEHSYRTRWFIKADRVLSYLADFKKALISGKETIGE